MGIAPWMLVTAYVDASAQREFDAWHRDVHLPRVLRIPGIVTGTRLSAPPFGPNYAALYVFADDAALRTALASAEAQEPRGDWERWAGSVRHLSVQFYTQFTAGRPLFRQN